MELIKETGVLISPNDELGCVHREFSPFYYEFIFWDDGVKFAIGSFKKGLVGSVKEFSSFATAGMYFGAPKKPTPKVLESIIKIYCRGRNSRPDKTLPELILSYTKDLHIYLPAWKINILN